MTTLIPASYLAAGSFTFESLSGGLVYWRVSWGGAGYTGPNTGQLDNTTGSTGNFGPAFAGPLPSTGRVALKYNPACPPATSNGNNADYTVTAGNATFFNDSGTSFQVVGGVPTLSQWSLMSLALLVLTCGTLAIRAEWGYAHGRGDIMGSSRVSVRQNGYLDEHFTSANGLAPGNFVVLPW